MKICKLCKKEKPLKEFHKAGVTKSGKVILRGSCKECVNAKRRVKKENRKLLPKEIINDIVYQKCKRMAYDAYARVTAPSRKNKKSYRNLENPFGFKNSTELKMFLFSNFYDDIKSLLDEKDTPSLDRIDSSKGYTKENIRVISFKKNTKLGVESRKRQIKLTLPNGDVKIFESVTDCAMYLGYNKEETSRVSGWARGNYRYKKPNGYEFSYVKGEVI